VIRELASYNQGVFIDLFSALGGNDFNGEVTALPLTSNGVHYTEVGYRTISRELFNGLGYERELVSDLDDTALTELRTHIIEKNRLFFNRWRPANETYLFLFRAHEQGRNAKEIPMFDPIIAEEEKKIENARQSFFAGQPKN